MSWRSRFKVVIGVLLVVLLCASLFVWWDMRRSVVASESAEISADSYTVGIDHTGLVTRQFVKAGDHVEEGQTLFQIRSTSLQEQIHELDLSETDLLYPLSEDGEILVQASRPGLVSEVSYNEGSFVPANEEIATIIDQTSLEVVATYRLARRDFILVSPQTRMDVQLPGGVWNNGAIRNIEVVEQGGSQVIVEITAAIQSTGNGDFRSTSGVPVETRVHLRDDTLYARIKNNVNQWMER